ncbi:MAG TPA: rod shape-determining protein RodA [Spirochaetia bacterium]|nr:rod shape-determining protein RodA [Spirochaetia bacterium]
MRRSVAFSFDFVLFGATFLLILIGVLFVYSSGVNSSGVSISREYLKQLIWAGTGIGILLLFSFLNYGTLRMVSVYLYAVSLLLLLVTLAVGKEVNGHRSWLGVGELGIQPSEFAKISCILFLATYLSNIGNGVRELPRLFLGVLIIVIPLGLILLQPDLGTTLVLVMIFLLMAFLAGAQLRHLFFIFSVGVLTIVLAALPSILQRTGHGPALLVLMREPTSLLYLIPPGAVVAGLSLLGYRVSRRVYFYRIFYFASLIMIAAVCSIAVRLALKDYQIMRFVIFLNPHLDPQGSGWNILQSLTAIGSGGFHGKGFLHGTQSHYQFLPSQSTDFIFSILTEEWGFLGGLLVLGLYLVILLRGLSTVWSLRADPFAHLVGGGILSMFFLHAVINAGMAMGIMPVTGIPLLFLSYGGSSLWSALASVGILINLHRRRYRFPGE